MRELKNTEFENVAGGCFHPRPILPWIIDGIIDQFTNRD